MDFDSSAKFISSLAKFLQSLCNGYVEFDNGVEVIGHIYLNVDTGKKIDYILNEKVCKTDENSVTFISNSFHAQPAEKPKPVEKPKQIVPSEQDVGDSEIILMDDSDKSYDQYSDNVQHNSTLHPKSKRPLGASKRSYSQSFPSNRPSSKASKFDSTSSSNPNGAQIPSNNSANDSSFNLNMSGNITAASEADLSHLSQVFPESVNDSSNATQERDIKPVLDKDFNVINVKQEYDPSDGQGDGNTYDEQGDGSFYHDQSYESGSEHYYGSGHRDPSQRSDYDPLSSKMYHGEAGSSGSAGDNQEFLDTTLFMNGSLRISSQLFERQRIASALTNRVFGNKERSQTEEGLSPAARKMKRYRQRLRDLGKYEEYKKKQREYEKRYRESKSLENKAHLAEKAKVKVESLKPCEEGSGTSSQAPITPKANDDTSHQ